MRDIERIVIHHTAGGREETLESIRHRHVDELGWSDIGYHYLIEKDGVKRYGRPEWRIGAHVRGKNRTSIGVAVMGYYEEEEFGVFSPQSAGLIFVLTDLVRRHPEAKVVTHRELANTLCPGKHVQAWVDRWREYRSG